MLHRLRQRLAEEFADAKLPTFTVSLGLVDSMAAGEFTDLVKLADRALLQAKADGRDRIVIWDASMPAAPSTQPGPGSVDDVGDPATTL